MNDERDDFWQLDMITPKKRSGHQKTFAESDSVTFGDGTGEKRYPIPKRDEARHLAAVQALKDAEGAAARPLLEYVPDGSLIMKVRVYKWPGEYSFYERFITDAMKYYRVKCDPVPFVPFFSYTPQYNQMNIDQLRYYIYWRYRFRKGEYLKTDYSYIFLYLYELINLEDVSDPESRMKNMCRVWLAYRKEFPRLDRYFGEWLCDFCLIHRLEPPTELLGDSVKELLQEVSLREFYMTRGKAYDVSLFSFVKKNNTYRYERSSVYNAKNKPIFDAHLFAAVVYALEKTENIGEGKAKYSRTTVTRPSYANALCVYSVKKKIEVEYLSFNHTYRFRGLITSFVKCSENGIRASLGMKTRLSCPGLSNDAIEAIYEYYEKNLPRVHFPEVKQKTPEDIRYDLYDAVKEDFSFENAARIEEKSWELTKALVSDEEDEAYTEVTAPVPSPPEPVTEGDEDGYYLLVQRLDPLCLGYIRAVFNNAGGQYARDNGVFESALEDIVNELSSDLTGDIILENGMIVEDYKELIAPYLEVL